MRKYLVLAVLASGLLASSCHKDDNNGNTTPPAPDSKIAFTVQTGENGPFKAPYRVLLKDATAQEVAAYQPSSGTLQPLVRGVTQDGKYNISIDAVWAANTAKTIFMNDNNSMSITIEDNDTTTITLTSKTNEGTVIITKFGDVGGTIEGTFKGTFTSSGGGDVSITDGKFTLKRDPDIE